MVRKRQLIATEYQECLAYYQWAQTQPIIRDALFKVVNEGRRHVIEGKRLRAIGLRAGIPDYCLPIKNQKYGSLWIEMKRSQNASTSPAQSQWINLLRNLGHFAAYAYGAEDAIRLTLAYMRDEL